MSPDRPEAWILRGSADSILNNFIGKAGCRWRNRADAAAQLTIHLEGYESAGPAA